MIEGKLASVRLRDGQMIVTVDGQQEMVVAVGESVVIEATDLTVIIGEDFAAIRDKLSAGLPG
jgi:K+/H+ antiporter YhaU regulatory subunit KhtT